MSNFKGDDRAADGLPVEVKLENGGYYEAFLMDIINGEALIHFFCDWIPERKYQFSDVRFPPSVKTSRCDLEENMIAEVLVNKNKELHEGWFRCRIQMLKSEFCQFEYLGPQNGSDFGYTCNVRRPHSNSRLSMSMLYVYKIIIPEDLREYSKCKNAHRTLKDGLNLALVNYDADSGELVIISRNISDMTRAEMLEYFHLRSLAEESRYLQVRGKLNLNLEIPKSDTLTAVFTVPKHYLGLAIGNEKVHLRAAQILQGINSVHLLRKTNKFLIHGKSEEAIKEARELLEVKIEPYPVLEEHLSQLVGGESENIHTIIRATGAAEIYVEHIKDALKKNEQTKDLPIYIIGTTQAIEKAKLFIQFQIDHINEVQSLRDEKMKMNSKIEEFVRTATTPEAVVSTHSDTVKSTRQFVPSTSLPKYNVVELEEFHNLNELLLDDYEGATDLNFILESIETRNTDLDDNTTDINLEDPTTTCINLEDITEDDLDLGKDIDLEDNPTTYVNLDLGDINEEDLDLGDKTTRLNVSVESSEDSSNILDTPLTISKIGNLPELLNGVKKCDDYVMSPPNEIEKIESAGFQFVEDPDFWTCDIDNTPSKPLLKTQDTTYRNQIKKQVVQEINGVISEAVTYMDQTCAVKETKEIHLQEENLLLEANSSTPNCFENFKTPIARPRLSLLRSKKFRNISAETDDMIQYSSPSSSQEKSITSKSETSSFCDSESQCDDQGPDCYLSVSGVAKHLDYTDASDDMGFEGQDSTIPLKDDKDGN